MPKPVHCQVTIQFLNGTTVEKETTVTVAPGDLDAIRRQIEPSALVATDAITIPFRAADAVPDRIRYTYRRPRLDDVLDEETFPFDGQTIPVGTVAPRQVERSILLLLESPHTHETKRDLKPVYPAAGSTGAAIHRNKDAIASLLEKIPAERFDKETTFILVNPVPHPTSCRREPINKPLRNQLMQFALTEVDRIKEGFHRRLRDYHPVVIINACTGQSSQDGLPSDRVKKPDAKELVRRELWAFFDNKPVHRICCNLERIKVGSQIHNVLTMREFPPDGDEEPAYYVVDFPHPSGWRCIWREGWFWGSRAADRK